MSDLEALPPDQRAAVQLLVKQGQTYDQLAGLLGIDPGGVRTRAHTALERLSGGAPIDAGARADVSDYLLGQQSVSQREATRERLASDPAAREWATAVAETLRPLAGDALPEIPSGAPAAPREAPPVREEMPAIERVRREERARSEERPPVAERPSVEGLPGLDDEPAGFDAPATRERRTRPGPVRGRERARARTAPADPSSSRLGGALLLAGLGIVIAVALVLLINGGDDGGGGGNGNTVSRTAPTQTSTTQQRPIAQINLFSATGNSRQVGLAQVFQQGNRRALIVAGQGLRPGAYALWLYTSAAKSRLLGFVPERVGSDGRFATQGELPNDAESYEQLVVTRERVTSRTRRPPTRPGTIVLRGDVNLRGGGAR